MLATGQRDGFGVHSRVYYQTALDLFGSLGKCELVVASFEQKPLAAIFVFINGRRSWYFYGASGDDERNRMPAYLLQWEAMKLAAARGCREYDLWGSRTQTKRCSRASLPSGRTACGGCTASNAGLEGA